MKKYEVLYEVTSNKGNHTQVNAIILSDERESDKIKESVKDYLSLIHHKVNYVMVKEKFYVKGYAKEKVVNTYYLPISAKCHGIKRESKKGVENIIWYLISDEITNIFHFDEDNNMVKGFVD